MTNYVQGRKLCHLLHQNCCKWIFRIDHARLSGNSEYKAKMKDVLEEKTQFIRLELLFQTKENKFQKCFFLIAVTKQEEMFFFINCLLLKVALS